MSRAATVYVCSEDATETVGTAEVVECYLDDVEDPSIILRGVMFDAERVLSSQVRVLQHDIEYYKRARDAEYLKAPEPVPERTITAERYRQVHRMDGGYVRGYEDALAELGGVVEPEPTEAEKLETLIKGHINVGGTTPRSLAEYLTAHGVTV